MGVVSSWAEMKTLPMGVFEDALMVLGAEGAALKAQREKMALKAEPKRRVR
jgi:hypothetical protein